MQALNNISVRSTKAWSLMLRWEIIEKSLFEGNLVRILQKQLDYSLSISTRW